MKDYVIRYNDTSKAYYVIENYMYLPNSFLFNNCKDLAGFKTQEEFMKYAEENFNTTNSKYSDRLDFKTEKDAQKFIDWWESMMMARRMIS